MRVNGGEGFLVMAEDRARSLGLPFVSVAGTMERHDGTLATPVQENVGVDAARTRHGDGWSDFVDVVVCDATAVIDGIVCDAVAVVDVVGARPSGRSSAVVGS